MEISGYRDLTVLGRGGFSTVYRAHQESVQRDVALKVLSIHLAGADTRARFRRECATNGRVGTHPNIVTLFDSGFADDGSPYLAMQLCSGGSMSERLRSSGPLPIADVLRVGVKIAAALHYAHSAGVLHRDIKPENILVSDFGEPELADFGISAVDDQRLSTLTASSFTINHAAPEALSGKPSSVSSDVYGLSSTLFTLVTGRTPFNAPSSTALVALVNMVMNDPAPATGRADVPVSLEELLAAGLSKTPEGRPADARVFGETLQQIQRGVGLPVTEFASAPPPPIGTTRMAPLSGEVAAGAALVAAGALDTGDLPPTGAMPGELVDTGALPPTGPLPPTEAPAVADAAQPVGAVSPTGTVGPPNTSAGLRTAAATQASTPPDQRDRKAWWIAAAVLAGVILIGAIAYFVSRGTAGSASIAPGVPTSSSIKSTTSAAPATRSSAPSTRASNTATTPSTSTSAPPANPVIGSFGSGSISGGVVDCTADTDSVAVPMTWSSTGATTAWVAVDAPGGDAAVRPLLSGLPPTVPGRGRSSVPMPFACSSAQHVFTLTVQSASGVKTSSSLTYTRRLPATTKATTPKISTSVSTPPPTTGPQTRPSTPTTPTTSTAPTTSTTASPETSATPTS